MMTAANSKEGQTKNVYDTTEITCAIGTVSAQLHAVQSIVFLNDTTSDITADTQLTTDGFLPMLICEMGCSSHVHLFH